MTEETMDNSQAQSLASAAAQQQADMTLRDAPPIDFLANVGRDWVNSGVYRDNVVDRTADLFEKTTEWARERGQASIGDVTEPGTGVTAPVITKPGGAIEPFPEGWFDEYRETPKRKDGKANLTRAQSFIDHTNYHKGPNSALFADESGAQLSITSVLDYHAKDVPAFGVHRARFAFPFSKEWLAWSRSNGPDNAMSLAQFQHFLEDRFVDVVDLAWVMLTVDLKAFVGRAPDKVATQTRMLETAERFSEAKVEKLAETVDITNGSVSLTYKSENAINTVAAPSMFLISIPIFLGATERSVIGVRLRCRIVGEGEKKRSVWWYEMWRPEYVLEAAFRKVCEYIQTETKIPLFYGTPE